MSKHMVRLLIELPKGEAETAVNNWVANHNEWEDGPVEHSLSETAAGYGSGTRYVRGDYRFYQEETPTELLDALTSRLESIQGGLWYRVGYHECAHDEQNGGPCSWDRVRESGTVPADVPELQP